MVGRTWRTRNVVAAVRIRPGMRAVDHLRRRLVPLPIAKVAWHAVAIDIDPSLLEIARQWLNGAKLANCDFVTGDAYMLADLVPEPADFIFMANAFHGVPDRSRLADAVRAALRPGGEFAVVNWHQHAREETPSLAAARSRTALHCHHDRPSAMSKQGPQVLSAGRDSPITTVLCSSGAPVDSNLTGSQQSAFRRGCLEHIQMICQTACSGRPVRTSRWNCRGYRAVCLKVQSAWTSRSMSISLDYGLRTSHLSFASLALTRLDVLRLLIEHEPDGLPAGDIARRMAVPLTPCRHTWRSVRAGLIEAEQHNQSIIYQAKLDADAPLAGYLVKDCCGGRPEICAPLIADLSPCCTPRNGATKEPARG